MANTFYLIQTITVGAGGSSSINFTGIPGTYNDLVLTYSLRSSTTQNWTSISFNGSTSNFSGKTMQGSGSGNAVGGTGTNNDYMILMNTSSYTANSFSTSQIYLPNYTSSNNKSFTILTAQETAAAAAYMNYSGMQWTTGSAINQITLTPDSGTFVQYSSASLYAIKNS